MGDHLVYKDGHLLYNSNGHLTNGCYENPEYECTTCASYTLPNSVTVVFSGIDDVCHAFPGCDCERDCKCTYQFTGLKTSWSLTRTGNYWASGWVSDAFTLREWSLSGSDQGCTCGDARASLSTTNNTTQGLTLHWVPSTVPNCGTLSISLDSPELPGYLTGGMFTRTINWCPADHNVTAFGQHIICTPLSPAAACSDTSGVSVVYDGGACTMTFS